MARHSGVDARPGLISRQFRSGPCLGFYEVGSGHTDTSTTSPRIGFCHFAGGTASTDTQENVRVVLAGWYVRTTGAPHTMLYQWGQNLLASAATSVSSTINVETTPSGVATAAGPTNTLLADRNLARLNTGARPFSRAAGTITGTAVDVNVYVVFCRTEHVYANPAND